MVTFNCGHCGYTKDVDDKYAGKKVRCPKCQTPDSVSNLPVGRQAKQKETIKVYCPQCNKNISAPAEYAGRKVRCGNCKNPLTIPTSSQPQSVQQLICPLQTPEEIFAGPQNLLDMEKQAKTANMPELDKPLIPPEPESELQYDGSKYVETGVKNQKQKRDSLDLPVGALIGITVIIVLFALVINWELGSAERKPSAPQEQVNQADEFAAKFIGLLAKGEVNDASLMLVKEMQNADTNEKLQLVTGPIGKIWNDNHDRTISLSVQQPQENLYMFGYKLRTEEPQSVFVVISQDPNGFAIEGINCLRGSSLPLRIESSRCNQISRSLSEPFVAKVVFFMKKFLLIMTILFAVTRLSKAVVFFRAGESPWAAIIPFYHEWALAELGDRSGVWGIAAVILGGAPFIGQIIYMSFILYFSIGIAEIHDRGILFGLGLCFLPVIFYPIMVFAGD